MNKVITIAVILIHVALCSHCLASDSTCEPCPGATYGDALERTALMVSGRPELLPSTADPMMARCSVSVVMQTVVCNGILYVRIHSACVTAACPGDDDMTQCDCKIDYASVIIRAQAPDDPFQLFSSGSQEHEVLWQMTWCNGVTECRGLLGEVIRRCISDCNCATDCDYPCCTVVTKRKRDECGTSILVIQQYLSGEMNNIDCLIAGIPSNNADPCPGNALLGGNMSNMSISQELTSNPLCKGRCPYFENNSIRYK